MTPDTPSVWFPMGHEEAHWRGPWGSGLFGLPCEA